MIVKMCIICAKRVTNTDVSEKRAYCKGDMFCCSDCLRLIAQQQAKGFASVDAVRLEALYCVHCGSKVAPKEVEDGKAVVVTDVADKVGKISVCSGCSKRLLRMVEEWSRHEWESAETAADPGVTALDVPVVSETAEERKAVPRKHRSGRLAEAEAAMRRRSRILPPAVGVKTKPRKTSKIWLFVVVAVVIIAAVAYFLHRRAEKQRQEMLFTELKQNIDEAFRNEEFETVLSHLSEFRELHPDLAKLEEFVTIDDDAHNRIHSSLATRRNKVLKIPSDLERLLKLLALEENASRIASLSERDTFRTLADDLMADIAELRKKIDGHFKKFKTDFDKLLAETDLDGADAVIRCWSKELVSARKGFSKEEGESKERDLADAKQRLHEAKIALENDWQKAEKEGSVKEVEGDYVSAAEVYRRFCDVKYELVSEHAQSRWKSATKKAKERLRQFENDEKLAEAAFQSGDFEDARSIYIRYTDDGIKDIKDRARAGLAKVEEAIRRREEAERLRKAKIKAFKDSLSLMERKVKSEPERVLKWCRERLKTIGEIPLHDAKKMVLGLRNKAFRRLGFVEIRSRKYIVGSAEPFDENPQRTVALPTGVYVSIYEVSNAEYKKFIDAGGYENRKYWTEEGWKLMNQFVDSTGKPGPSFWWNGTYPIGTASEPVRGISWYEASAFAKWSGSRLPTAAEWEVAAGWDETKQKILEYPWGDVDIATKANLGKNRVCDVRKSFGDTSPTGVINTGGNVSEWTATVDDGRAVVKGGNFLDTDRKGARIRFSQKLPLDARLLYVGFRCVKEER